MGRYSATIKPTEGGRYSLSSASAASKKANTTEDLLRLAEQQGYKPKEKVGSITRLFNVLSAFEPGAEIATLARTGDAGRALKQYGSEVGRGLGSALPFLDPYTKPKELSSEREGFKEAFEAMGWKPTTKAGKFARGAAGLVGDIALDPGNLLLAPLFKTVARGAKGVTKVGTKALAKTEKGQQILMSTARTKELLGKAFKTGYKAKKVSPELVDFTEGLKRTMNVDDQEAVDIVKKLVDKYGEDAINKLPYEIEDVGQALKKTGVAKGGLGDVAQQPLSDVPELSKAAKEVTELIEKKTAQEIPLGLRTADVPDYFPRKVVKEPFKGYAGGLPEIKPSLKGAEKGRVFETLAEGEQAGYKYLEAPESLSLRLATSQRAIKAKSAINQLIAGEIKDLSGKSIIRKAGETGAEGMEAFSKIKELDGYVAHPDVVEYLEKVQKVFVNDDTTSDVLKIYDKVQNLWKGSVTSYFPAFHIRNALSNIFNNVVGGVWNPLSYTDAVKLQKGTGELTSNFKRLFPDSKTFEDARRVMAKLGVTGEGQFARDVPELFKKVIGKESLTRKLAKDPRRVGRLVEDNARIAHFIEKTRGGMDVKEAAGSVNKFLFDYSDLTPFERNVMKRVFPFYVFSRKNVPLQLEQIFKQPVKYKAVGDAIAGLQTNDLTPEEKRFMPDYISEKFGISVGKSKQGYPQMLAGLGLPLEDIAKLDRPGKSVLDMLSPIPKTLAEKATGRSFFFDRAISDTSSYNATTKAVGSIPVLKQFLKAKEATDSKGNKYYRVDPNRMYNLKAIVGRFMGTAEKLTDTRKSFLWRLINSLTGAKIYTPDIDREKEEVLMKMLKELGLVKTFTKDYVPKDIKGELGI